MNKSKVLSVFTAIVMCFCAMLSSFSVSAADNNDKKYTLEELFAMSKEEFFAVEYIADNGNTYTGKYVYECAKSFTEIGYMVGGFYRTLGTENEYSTLYTANITEMELEKLIGNTIEYEMGSPIITPTKYEKNPTKDSIYYIQQVEVAFSGFDINGTISDEKLLNFAKCWFCINQVMDFYYYDPSLDYDINWDEKVLDGDVNFDKNFDLYDIIWIAKSLINEFELTEAQVIVADTNGDGVADLHDAINLAKKLME